VLSPAVADAVLAVCWSALALDTLRHMRRERAARAALGPVLYGGWRPRWGVVLGFVAATLAGAAALERLAGRLPFHDGAALLGLALVAGGLVLNVRARRALGPHWTGTVEVRARHALIMRGPYARVRHPIYLSGLLLASGSFLAHPSTATACLAGGLSIGLLLKTWLEERTLRTALGPEYARYAARVPALLPRLVAPRVLTP
jgi:protein-S-isoprenylcysteine O-methyltransferase Ste14